MNILSARRALMFPPYLFLLWLSKAIRIVRIFLKVDGESLLMPPTNNFIFLTVVLITSAPLVFNYKRLKSLLITEIMSSIRSQIAWLRMK